MLPILIATVLMQSAAVPLQFRVMDSDTGAIVRTAQVELVRSKANAIVHERAALIASGTYSVDRSGVRLILISAPGYLTFRGTPSKVARLREIRLLPAISLRGYVRDALTGVPLRAHVQVAFMHEDQDEIATVRTDRGTGSYVHAVAPGTVEMVAWAAGFAPSMRIVDSRDAKVEIFSLVRSVTIQGTLVNGAGQAVAGGEIRLNPIPGSGSPFKLRAVSHSDGSFVLREVSPTAKYGVIVGSSGCEPVSAGTIHIGTNELPVLEMSLVLPCRVQ